MYPKELQWVLYRHVFAHICYVLQELARTEIYVKRSIIPFINSHKETNMVSICLLKYVNYYERKKWQFYVV